MTIASAYKDYINSKARYCVLIGGAGAGKSETAARKTILRALEGGRHLVIRKYATTLRQSVIHTILTVLKDEQIRHEYKPSERVIYLTDTGGEILFLGFDDEEKIKSIHKISSVWIEEASEITSSEFTQIDLRLRGETGHYKQITLTLNPVPMGKWVISEIINIKPAGEVYTKIYTYRDNPFLDSEYVKVLNNITDEVYRKIYLNGEWADNSRLIVFNNYFVASDVKPEGEVVYGIDFGYNNPTAVVRCGKCRDGYSVEEVFYRSYVTNNELIEFLKNTVPAGALLYCDSAEPARIEELRRVGFNAKPANKDVRGGLAWLRSQKLYIAGDNLLKEIKNYQYKTDPGGNILDEVVKANDHLVDAMRYALFTHFASMKRLSEKEIIVARMLNV